MPYFYSVYAKKHITLSTLYFLGDSMFRISKHHIVIVGKTLIVQVGLFLFVIALLWGGQKVYSIIDRSTFPTPFPVQYSETITEEEKGIIILNALTNRMRYELDSTFGWSANDIIFNKWIMDNRAYRQFGTYVATKMLFDHFSTIVAKLGMSDREDDDLYESRLNHFAISPKRWGILFLPSSEKSYGKALELVSVYQENLLTGDAVYNCRTDDIYSIFNVVLSETVFGYAMGLLQDAQSLPFYEIDNRIYEVQGMMLVVRDYLNAIYILYPEIASKNNQENMKEALYYLDLIATYDPLYTTSTFNSGELILSYLFFARNRLTDIRDSIRI